MCDQECKNLVCRCEEVTREEIEYAIEHGADTMNGVKRRTRAGMGFCQGKTCKREVARILAEKTGRSVAEIDYATVRAPLRPISIEIVGGDYSEDEE